MDTLLSKEHAMAALPLIELIQPDDMVVELGANRYINKAIAERAKMSVTVEWDSNEIVKVLKNIGGRENHRYIHSENGPEEILNMDINEHADFYVLNMDGYKHADLVNAAVAHKISKFKSGCPVVFIRNADSPLVKRAMWSFKHSEIYRGVSGVAYAVCSNDPLRMILDLPHFTPDHKVAVYICSRDGNPHRHCVESVERECGLHHPMEIIRSPFSIAEGRNTACQKFVAKSGCDAMLFVDDTVIIPEGAIEELYNSQGDIVSACVPSYQAIGDFMVPSVMVRRKGGGWSLTWPPKEQFQIELCGMACALIRRRVFDKIGFPFFIWPKDHDWFTANSEDTEFCTRAADLGFEIWCNGAVQCGHRKTVDMGQMMPAFGEKIPRKTWKGPQIAREHVLQHPVDAPEDYASV